MSITKSTHTMAFVQQFRRYAPEYCDHVRFLTRYAMPEQKELDAFFARANVAALKNDKDKMTDAFKGLIKSQLQAAGITFVMENLPQYAPRQCDGGCEKITGKSIHDTMEQFGNVQDAVVYKNHAYVWFSDVDDSRRTHSLVNNMMIGDNIVSTAVIVP